MEEISGPREGVQPAQENRRGDISASSECLRTPCSAPMRNVRWPREGQTILEWTEQCSKSFAALSSLIPPSPPSLAFFWGLKRQLMCWGEGNKKGRRSWLPSPEQATCKLLQGAARPSPNGKLYCGVARGNGPSRFQIKTFALKSLCII